MGKQHRRTANEPGKQGDRKDKANIATYLRQCEEGVVNAEDNQRTVNQEGTQLCDSACVTSNLAHEDVLTSEWANQLNKVNIGHGQAGAANPSREKAQRAPYSGSNRSSRRMPLSGMPRRAENTNVSSSRIRRHPVGSPSVGIICSRAPCLFPLPLGPTSTNLHGGGPWITSNSVPCSCAFRVPDSTPLEKDLSDVLL